ncbi:hypothetical protein [Arenimonas donghaensis]|uniref:Uncharacterized protein n=1 Tax=Arenimonas donghaensis DSM 18148 = HO3-R19 TaxID=1121014 RepID=A0A087ML19_9GAMM|nr:hypothetical protein [Arenimonas donghaensis]KFL37572.1 hypothetical protein N788_09295 [Arenimonas donghaensis DSM 18148 = HO3-R19]
MSIDLIYPSLYEALSLADASLQLWISITFMLMLGGTVRTMWFVRAARRDSEEQ